MPTPLIVPSNLAWIGGAKEVTPGTPVAAPAFWIPVDGSSIKYKPNVNPLTDSAFRGLMSADFQQIAGMRFDTLSYKSFAYLDSVYQHFLAACGKIDTVTGTVDPALHKTSVENGVGNPQAQPMTFTLFYFDGVTCWQIPGCMIASLKTTVKVDELVSIEPSWIGMPAIKLGAAPVNTPSTTKPIPSWNSVISVAGSPVSSRSEIDIEFKRDAAEVPTINNSQSPLSIFSGPMSVAINMTAVYQGGATDPDVLAFLANTQAAVSVKMSPVGDLTHFLLLQHSVFAYDSAEPSHGNKWVEITSSGKALANATDALDGKQSNAQVQLSSTQITPF